MTTAPVSGCVRCTLSGAHPFARLDADGICAVCRRTGDDRREEEQKRWTLEAMESVLEKTRAKEGTRVLLAYSGGKDSSYTLLQLRRRFGLRVLALTVDNGFLSPVAVANAKQVADQLGVQHEIVRPRQDLLRHLFVRALQPGSFPRADLARASSVCNACIAVVKSLCLREAFARRMEVIAWGWSPGQAPVTAALHRPEASWLHAMRDRTAAQLERMAGPETRNWLAPAAAEGHRVRPWFVHPLAVLPYDEARMLAELRELGWRRPKDVDPNSTNCRLNALGNHVHLRQEGYHPYALEIAGLVREGVLAPEEARRRLAEDPDPRALRRVVDELGPSDTLRASLAIP